jgi:hypothetical protein
MKGGEAARKRNSSCAIISGRISRGQLLVTSSPSMIKIFLSFFIYLMLPLWKFVTMSEYVQKNQSGYSIPASPGPFAVGPSSLI